MTRRLKSNQENIAQWTQQLHDIHPPVCTADPTVTLPRRGLLTQLDYLQCFVDEGLITTMVTNTNLYAISRQAVAWVPVTTEEMWRYLAIRIRQGIVVLPELHHYWGRATVTTTRPASCPGIASVNSTATSTSHPRSLAVNGKPSSRRLTPSTTSVTPLRDILQSG